MKKYIALVAALLTLGFTSCVNDLKVECINTFNQSSTVDLPSLFAKVYATLGLTGQKGPDGNGDVSGVDEGTSSFYRMNYELQEFPCDQIYWIWPDVGVDDIRKMKWTASNTLLKGLYGRLYFDITLCNLFLDKFEAQATPEQVAEVRFIRALNYWYLLDMFGNVPDVFEAGLTELPDQIMRPQLYDKLKAELIEVEEALPAQRVSYYRVDKAAAQLLLSRLCLNAAVYGVNREGQQEFSDEKLQQEYTDAAKYANMVILNQNYELATKYSNLWAGDNDNMGGSNDAWKEMILTVPQDGIQTQSWGGSLFLIASCTTGGMPATGSTEQWKCIRSRAQLVGLFINEAKYHQPIPTTIETKEAAEKEYGQYFGTAAEITEATGDDRALFCNYSEDGDNVYVCQFWKDNKKEPFCSGWGIQKFSNLCVDANRKGSDAKFPDMDLPLMRKAEAYLNYAEAVLRGGEQCGMTVDEAVNTVRRRSISDQALADQSDWNLDDKPCSVDGHNILDERGRELYSEGLRRSDMIRFGIFTGTTYRWENKAGDMLGSKANPEAYRILYPLPLSEVTANHKLLQNKGYEVN